MNALDYIRRHLAHMPSLSVLAHRLERLDGPAQFDLGGYVEAAFDEMTRQNEGLSDE